MKSSLAHYFYVAFACMICGCYSMRCHQSGGKIKDIPPRQINLNDIGHLPGYKIDTIVSGLTYPTSLTFDDEGWMYVIEAGYSYGEVWEIPKLLRVDDNKITEIARGDDNGPWTGVMWHDGAFYVAEGGAKKGGSILKITRDGKITALITGLPTMGDHHTNGPVIKNSQIYFTTGVATNSAVVGVDNEEFGWLSRYPSFHDIPCEDIVLNGINYDSDNPLTDDPNDKSSTGAFVSFGTKTTAGQVVEGKVPCTGAVLRMPLSGGKAECVAWGFRNPFGIALSPTGEIYITENGYDERGSRPVWGSGDVLWKLEDDTWYGWPDYSAGQAIDDYEFKPPGDDKVKRLLQKIPNTPPTPAAIFDVHSSSNGFAFSTNDQFGYKGEAFVAQFGDMEGAGKVLNPVGFKIVRANPETGVVRDFLANKGRKNGPASWLKKGGLERPVDVKFSADGMTMYVVDFGIMKTTEDGIIPVRQTGVIWKITKE